MAQQPSFGARGKKRILELPEAASQTFVAGDFLILDGNGRVQQALAAGARLAASSGATGNRVVGRACAPASGVTGRYVPVMIAEPGTEFQMPVYHSTGSSALPNTNQVGKQYELIRVDAATDYYAVDLEHSTNVKGKVTDMVPGPAGHDGFDGSGIPTAASTVQYGLVWFEFMAVHTIYGGGA